MTTPCIITVAITGSLPGKKDNPAVPISVEEQIESTHEAFEAALRDMRALYLPHLQSAAAELGAQLMP